jgi:hypothetical protein
MIKKYQIKLNDVVIPDIRSVTVTFDGPASKKGVGSPPTKAADVEIVRNASERAILDPFALVTNEDGKMNIVTAEIDFTDDEGRTEYHFNIKKALVYEWKLDNPSTPTSPTLETFKLKVGDMVYIPKDSEYQRKFEVEAFQKLKVGTKQ